MKKFLVVGFLFSILNAGATPVQAQPQPRQAGPQEPQVRYKQVTHHDFDDDEVQGTLLQPDETRVTGLRKAGQQSLVQPRANFIPELLKSVEGL